jgi:hypothetical protein
LLDAQSIHSSSSFQQRFEEGGNSMRQKNFWFVIGGILAVFALVMMVPTAAAANNYKVLHKFTGKDGAGPSAGLIFDAAGNLYGTTSSGGDLTCPDSVTGCGVVFKLARQSDGSWAEVCAV